MSYGHRALPPPLLSLPSSSFQRTARSDRAFSQTHLNKERKKASGA
jgi:hypothetical protein